MKRLIFIVLGIIITVSIINNVKNQYSTLKEAEKQNLNKEMEIDRVNRENQILEKKIEYATSSAFIEKEMREKLALGKENDVWLELGPEQDSEFSFRAKDVETIPIIRQWINLFTH